MACSSGCVPASVLTCNAEKQTVAVGFLGLCARRGAGPDLKKQTQICILCFLSQTKKIAAFNGEVDNRRSNNQTPSTTEKQGYPKLTGGHTHLEGFRAVSQQSLYIPSSRRHQFRRIVGFHGEVGFVFTIYLRQSEEKGRGQRCQVTIVLLSEPDPFSP